MVKNKNRRPRSEGRWIIFTAPEGRKDEKGQECLRENRLSLEHDGFRVISMTRFESGNMMLTGERPIR